MFAKYDADGDNGLNLNEQGRMQRDLEDQKVYSRLYSFPRFYVVSDFDRSICQSIVVPGTVVVSRRRRLLRSQTDTSC